MDLGFGMIQEPHQDGDSSQLPDVLLDRVVLVAEVLQIRRGVGLHRVHGVAQHGDDLPEVGIPPARILADGVEAHHAGALLRDERLRTVQVLETELDD